MEIENLKIEAKKIVPERMPQFFPEKLFIPPKQQHNRYNQYNRSHNITRMGQQKGNIQFRLR